MRRYVIVGLLVVCVAAALSGCAPKSSLTDNNIRSNSPSKPITAGAPAGPLLADGQQCGDMQVWLSSTPAQPVAGGAQLDTFLTDGAGKPLRGAQVTYDIDMTNMSHGTYLVPAESATAGHYSGRVHFSMAGPWRVIATVVRPGEPDVRCRFEFRVNAG